MIQPVLKIFYGYYRMSEKPKTKLTDKQLAAGRKKRMEMIQKKKRRTRI
jgi:hypothetical protein